MLVANLDSSDYLGAHRHRPHLQRPREDRRPGGVCKLDGSVQQTRITKLFAFDGLKRVDITEAAAGDIVCLAGIEDITIGETIADPSTRCRSRRSRSTSRRSR
jgi:GTP-binding protein